jgi:PHD/YefM family antitoxin component YafN of YafNO toxin-antitoxin module
MWMEKFTMTIELTPQQLQVLDGREHRVPRVVDPRNNASYVLVSEAEYETVREVLEDERRQRGIRRVALRNAIGRMGDAP